MVTPVQVDRWGQGNISALGSDFQKPKVQMLGVRGFPGNSISHKNSMFLPNHSKRTFVEGEVDVVASVGFKKDSWPAGAGDDFVELGLIVTNLCVFDFGGPDHAARVLSLHPGVTFEEVQDNTGFPLLRQAGIKETAAPTEEQLAIIRNLDPKGVRTSVLKGNPPGVRAAAERRHAARGTATRRDEWTSNTAKRPGACWRASTRSWKGTSIPAKSCTTSRWRPIAGAARLSSTS
jgi:glutaconate CoA-transferase subunit B